MGTDLVDVNHESIPDDLSDYENCGRFFLSDFKSAERKMC